MISSDAGLLDDDALDDVTLEADDALDVDALDVDVVNATALESTDIVIGVPTTSTPKADAARLPANTRDAADANIARPTRDEAIDAARDRVVTRDAVWRKFGHFVFVVVKNNPNPIPSPTSVYVAMRPGGRRRARRPIVGFVIGLLVVAVSAVWIDGASARVVRADSNDAFGGGGDGDSSIEATLTQRYPGAATYVKVRVKLERSSAGESDGPVCVTVHERGGSVSSGGGTGGCEYADVGPVYDPDGVGGSGAVGNVCEKMGNKIIADASGREFEYVDMDLPLYGRRSVVGRSLAVWRGDSASDATFSGNKRPVACAKIREDGDVKYTVLQAQIGTTLSRVSGVVTFSQPSSDVLSDTKVTVKLVDRAQSQQSNNEYRWAIHSGSAGIANACSRVGEVYNPQDAEACGERGAGLPDEDCPVGEISSRHGTLSAPSLAMYTDSNLPLSGPDSIAGKSLVLLDQSGNKVLCSDIKKASDSGRAAAVSKLSTGAQVGILTFLLVVFVFGLRHYGRRNGGRGDFSRMSDEFREIPLAGTSSSPFSIGDDGGDNFAAKARQILRETSSKLAKAGQHKHSS